MALAKVLIPKAFVDEGQVGGVLVGTELQRDLRLGFIGVMRPGWTDPGETQQSRRLDSAILAAMEGDNRQSGLPLVR
jgi:hypothetical protein